MHLKISFIGAIAVCAFLGSWVEAEDEKMKSQLDMRSATEKQSDSETAYRVLFIGDSISRHGFNKNTTQKLGWDHVAGMAASAEAKDYAHQFEVLVQERMTSREVEIYFHTSGGGGSAANRLGAIADVKNIEPHLVVIQLGEHEKGRDGEEVFRGNYSKLIASFDKQIPRPLIICTGIWDPGERGQAQYSGWTARVEVVMREECFKQGIPFASVEKYAMDPTCSGWGESRGVRWHPNDKGHLGYATALIECYDSFGK